MATRWNWDLGLWCEDCHASLWEEEERAFPVAPHAYICEECGRARGGVFDAKLEMWTVPPDLRTFRRSA